MTADNTFNHVYHFSDPTATLLVEWPGGGLGAKGFGALNKRCDIIYALI